MSHGVKFTTEFEEEKYQIDQKALELLRWCKIFAERKLAPAHPTGSHGNLSYRFDDSSNEFVITSSQMDLSAEVYPDLFVKVNSCDTENFSLKVSGSREPSSESFIHAYIYETRPEVGAIMHGHSEELMVNAEKLGIPVTETEAEFGTLELLETAKELIKDKNVFILKNHGFFSLGDNLSDAGTKAIELLNKCQ